MALFAGYSNLNHKFCTKSFENSIFISTITTMSIIIIIKVCIFDDLDLIESRRVNKTQERETIINRSVDPSRTDDRHSDNRTFQ